MSTVVKAVAFIALVAATVWAVNKPGYDSICAALGALVVLVGAFVADKRSASMSQKVGKGGKGIQAGGNITINK